MRKHSTAPTAALRILACRQIPLRGSPNFVNGRDIRMDDLEQVSVQQSNHPGDSESQTASCLLYQENARTTHIVRLLADFNVRHLGGRVERVERARALKAELEPVGSFVQDDSECDAALLHRQRLQSRTRRAHTGQHHSQQGSSPRTWHSHR